MLHTCPEGCCLKLKEAERDLARRVAELEGALRCAEEKMDNVMLWAVPGTVAEGDLRAGLRVARAALAPRDEARRCTCPPPPDKRVSVTCPVHFLEHKPRDEAPPESARPVCNVCGNKL